MVDVIHTPHGLEHPYEQLPEECVPRRPLAGEPFTVGVVTRPAGSTRSVQIRAFVDDQPYPDVEAVLVPDWRPKQEDGVGAEYLDDRVTKYDQDVWQAHLTAPAFGETLSYAVETEHGVSSLFTMRGEAWVEGGSVNLNGNTLTINRAGTDTATLPAGTPELQRVEWLSDGQRARRVRLTFAANADERFFGLGERFNALDQRGNIMDIRVYEQYKNQGKRTYMPIPFLLSSAGYGVWVQSSRWMQFDLAASAPDVWVLEADLGSDETLALTWFVEADPVTIIGQFAQLTGPVALPPLWSFGLWMSSNEWNSQARTLSEVQASLDHGVPPSVIVLEAWSDEATFYIWNDAEYTPKPGDEAFSYDDFSFPAGGKWPNPAAMIDWLHTQGIKILLWQIPVMKRMPEPHAQQDNDRAYFEEAGLGVHDPDGSLHKLRPFWFQTGYVWDVTNPAARDWWFSKRAYLVDDLGVDGFKTDGGEHLWGKGMVFGDGRLGDELWNEYPQRYSEAYYQFANQHRNNDAVIFSRAGHTGSQRAPAHWAGDEHSTWDAYRHSIFAGLSTGISGIPFWGWDIAGFSGEIPTAELYLRATAMSVFCPIMQYHSEFNAHRLPRNDRTPWNMQERTGDTRVIDVFRLFTNVRHNLMPYIWQEAQHSAQTGEPMMRALNLWHSEASPYQYYFGRDLLICPIVDEGATEWSGFLPPGEWHDLWTGERYTGGSTLTLDVPIDRIPVFARAGARLPVCLGGGQLGAPVPLSGEPDTWLTFGSSQS